MADKILPNSSVGGNPQPSEGLRLKVSPNSPAVPCAISPAVYGSAFLTIYYNGRRDYVQLIGNPADLALELRRLADAVESGSVSVHEGKRVNWGELAEIPAILVDPVKAWPWLVARFPWLFDGIDLSREPYSSYVKGSRHIQADLLLLEPYLGQVLSQADIAQVLFGDRTKTGGGYRRRILAALAYLDTTSADRGPDFDLEDKKAA